MCNSVLCEKVLLIDDQEKTGFNVKIHLKRGTLLVPFKIEYEKVESEKVIYTTVHDVYANESDLTVSRIIDIY